MLLLVATVVLLFKRRAWVKYSLAAVVVLLGGYSLLLGFFSWASYDRTAKLGDEKFFCAMDCHIAYSVQNVERMRSIGEASAAASSWWSQCGATSTSGRLLRGGETGRWALIRLLWRWRMAEGGDSRLSQWPEGMGWRASTVTFVGRAAAPGGVV